MLYIVNEEMNNCITCRDFIERWLKSPIRVKSSLLFYTSVQMSSTLPLVCLGATFHHGDTHTAVTTNRPQLEKYGILLVYPFSSLCCCLTSLQVSEAHSSSIACSPREELSASLWPDSGEALREEPWTGLWMCSQPQRHLHWLSLLSFFWVNVK